MLFGITNFLRGRNAHLTSDDAPHAPFVRKPVKREWEQVLLASLETNNLAPSEETVLHAFDLYKDDLYGPVMERRLVISEFYSDIVADIGSLKALVPDLIERAAAYHPFEFSQIREGDQ